MISRNLSFNKLKYYAEVLRLRASYSTMLQDLLNKLKDKKF